MNRLSVLIPGLLGPIPELNESNEPLQDCPILQYWLACGDVSATGCNDYLSELAHVFGLDQSLAPAQLSALADELYQQDAHCLRADPVHFKADLDNARLISGHQLDILESEAAALVDAFNTHFADDGLQLHYQYHRRWYLKSSEPLAVDTVQIERALGRNVQSFLPKGDDELRWRKILNEAQMLFFTHEVNERRVQRDQLAINSLWLWGEGAPLSTVENLLVEKNIDWVMGNEILARGMAQLIDIDDLPLTQDVNTLAQNGGHGLLVIDDAYLPMASGHLPQWRDAVQAICTRWIASLDALLKHKRITRIDLYSAEGRCYSISAAKLKKFWRRPRKLAHYINTHA